MPKAASVDVKILNPHKAKPAIKGKAKGKINPLHSADSNTTVTLTANNSRNLMDFSLIKVTHKVGKKTVECTEQFEAKRTGYDKLTIMPKPYSANLDSGTYKAIITASFYDSVNSGSVNATTTVSFKVKRPKKITSFNRKSVSFANRDYKRANEITVKIKDKIAYPKEFKLGSFSDKYVLERTEYNEFVLKLKPGYVAMKKNKIITKPTKDNVPIYVYYVGSTEPDVVKIKVTIYP